ncbi:subclass B1 metallo-beta-lactamase [Leeuwenhoekiella marinoflava]|uniref:Beta-lactamase n=2 Tax=Leeuwenhoekiella marinoflava TaxID=988 RepID=A0A4Q0PN30_9FLAO|nr:subclass B1 metallo-beta-lactamase [Leeuwenhoekiella marinoflava]RXG31920.1 metallo-beta-lactamase class B [Leeuwenhoekiella marinoflava]SHE91706.1 metallo-beta-lactamase class B [Leeuwenhoekiella marinoflava DSM 3653]
MPTSIKWAILFCLVFLFGFQQPNTSKPEVVYQSERLIITRLSDNAFQHVSFLQTQDFGKVACNGLIVRDGNEAVVYDTPTDDTGSRELIAWIADGLQARVKAVIPTHFHADCLGGLQEFHKHGIPSYAHSRTLALAREHGYTVPQQAFEDRLTLDVGTQQTTAQFFGEGHTTDDVVGYFPSEHILFGGCLIKEMEATKGYLGDANLNAWSDTVRLVKAAYPDVQHVVPGHGEPGDSRLLDYTIALFDKN